MILPIMVIVAATAITLTILMIILAKIDQCHEPSMLDDEESDQWGR